MAEFTDMDLIGYCELHCQTERALFSGKHINRMLALAGHPEPYVREVPEERFFSVHSEMENLCKLARERLAAPTTDKEQQ
jgi:hypothetical protein